MENKGILVNVFELETGLTTYKDCEYIRITDEKYNLLVMLDYTPIIGEVNGKIDIMYNICKAKFTQNETLKTKLLKTGDAMLIEGNTWGDKIWGQVNGVGENNLGKILMRIREELKD